MALRRKGYTLVEALLVIAIIGVLTLVGPRILIQWTRFYKLQTARTEIQRDARAALENINRYLRQATQTSVVISQESGQPPHSSILFQTVQGTNFKFYQQGTYLYAVTNGSTSTVSAGNLRYIGFSYPRSDDPTLIAVALTMERSTYQESTKALQLSIEKVRVMN